MTDDLPPDKPNGEDTQSKPLSSEEFAAALDALLERARAAGVRPIQVMASTYIKQGLGMIDGLLAALEEGNGKKKKKKKKQAP